MTTTGYLILISALCALAGFMVYTRLSLRPKRRRATDAKRDFAAVEEPVFSSGTQSGKAVSIEQVEEPASEGRIEARPVSSSVEEPVDGYFDDLQKAAEGLAELMRSSAEDRVPEILSEKSAVVESRTQEHHDPPVQVDRVEAAEIEISEEEEITRIRAEICGENQELLEKPALPEVSAREWLEEAEPSAEATADSVVEENEPEEEVEAIVETLPVVKRTHREIVVQALGEDVHDRIEAIDSGLDQLEELVRSIESSLASLSDITEEEVPAAAEAA